MNATQLIASIEAEISRDKAEIRRILDNTRAAGLSNLSGADSRRTDVLFDKVASGKRKLEKARAIEAEEADYVAGRDVRIPNPALSGSRRSDGSSVMHIGSEPRVYSRDNDPEGKGTGFLNDVVSAFRGNPSANERLARHQREDEVDNPRRQARAAGDATSAAFPNLIIPSYITSEYAAKPSAARPFADICRQVPLPDQGLKVELAKGNTSVTAGLQTSELVAVAGGNFDADPLELSVQTAESWALVSRQSIERGRATEQIVLNDLLDQMNTLVDSTLITQATTGLFDSGTRITYDSASPTFAELYPLILQGASKVAQTLLNKGTPSHVLMHPRRWYFLSSLVASTWPQVSQPGLDPQAMGTATGNAYNNGIAGVLPCGLKVVTDANVQTTALTTAQTGGTQDILYVVADSECILFEPPGREVYIRAEAPAAPQLGVVLVCYEYFSYTFSRYGATSVQRVSGTGTVPGSF